MNRLFVRFQGEAASGEVLRVQVRVGRDGVGYGAPEDALFPSSLIGACAALQRDPLVGTAAERRNVGLQIWNCLPAAANQKLRTYRQQPLHLVLDLLGAPSLRGLAFELLRCEEEKADGTTVIHAPVESARWHLARCFDSSALQEATLPADARLRVLVLVGSQIQPPAGLPADFDAAETVAAILEALRGTTAAPSPFEVHVAAAEGMLGLLPACDARALVDPANVLAVLREGGGFDVVHFVGHSDARASDASTGGARALRFEVDAADEIVTDAHGSHRRGDIPIAAIRDALTHTRARLFVLNACLSRELLAEPLLAAVDDLVGMSAMLPSKFCRPWCGSFYAGLASNASVAEAVRRAREAIQSADDPTWAPDFAWVPAHWTRVRDLVPFRNEQRRLLAEYFARVAAAHQDLHGGLLDARFRAVEQVPVQVNIARNDERERGDGEAALARHRELPTVATLVDEAPRRFSILGKPGAGKTTALRDLARRLAQARDGKRIPLFARLPEFAAAGGSTTLELLQHVLGKLGFRAEEGETLGTLLDEHGRKGELVVLLDGLDEVTTERVGSVHELLHQGFESWGTCPVLLTSRPFGYTAPHGTLREAEMLPLFPHQQEELLRRWFSLEQVADLDSLANAALRQIDKSPALQELAGTPLFLTLMAKQLARGTAVTELATQRHAFLGQVIDFLLRGKHKPKGAEKALEPVDTARGILGFVAFRLVRSFTVDVRRHTLVDLLPDAPAASFGAGQHWADAGVFLREAADRTLLLRPSDGDGTDDHGTWSFLHRSLEEALCAEHLVRVVPDADARRSLLDDLERELKPQQDGEETDLLAHDALRSLAESLALVTGWLESRAADEWVAELLRRPALRRVGIEAVALADTPSPATLAAALAACQDLSERRLVYEALGDRGADDALALLTTRARAIPRQWEELFYLEESVQRIETRQPRLRNAVATARAAVFAACPSTSDAQIAQALRTVPGKAGEALWREVPAGQFRMGSPDDERGRDDDETQFETEIPQRFWIGATTVMLAQFQLFDPEHRHPWGEQGDVPATEVTWFAATMFCRWLTWRMANGVTLLGGRAGVVARLPWEAEWECAARAGRATRFFCGDDLDPGVAWFDQEWGVGPQPLRDRRANEFGLYDVHGNVWEWCADWHEPYPTTVGSEVISKWRGARGGRFRVLRGGGCWSDADGCRSAGRNWYVPDRDYNYSGFRVVLALPPERILGD